MQSSLTLRVLASFEVISVLGTLAISGWMRSMDYTKVWLARELSTYNLLSSQEGVL